MSRFVVNVYFSSEGIANDIAYYVKVVMLMYQCVIGMLLNVKLYVDSMSISNVGEGSLSTNEMKMKNNACALNYGLVLNILMLFKKLNNMKLVFLLRFVNLI